MPFREVLGQERVIRVLRKALATDSLPHAYLFYGTGGVGRFKTARTLAAALFCASSPGDPCGTCSHCLRVQREEHPGLAVLRPLVRKDDKEWEVDPDRGEIRIDQIRELQKWFAVRSFDGGWRVCILDGAERMNAPAANALLKTLEEPPPESLLVLVSPTRTQLPPTVVSRCQTLYFPPVERAEIEEILRAAPGRGSPQDLFLLAALSGGSVGRALQMDPAWITGDRLDWIQGLRETTEGARAGSLLDLADALAKSDRVFDVLDLFLAWYRDLTVFRGAGDPDRLLNQDLAEEIREVAQTRDALGWAEKARTVQRARADLLDRRNLNAQLVMETMLLRLADRGPPLG